MSVASILAKSPKTPSEISKIDFLFVTLFYYEDYICIYFFDIIKEMYTFDGSKPPSIFSWFWLYEDTDG